MRVDEQVSQRIHALRFLLIVFVVFIHNNVIEKGVNFADGTQIFVVPLYVAVIKEFVLSITCVAVPLFFLIAGFLLYARVPTFMANVKKKSRTLLCPYLLWTIALLTCYAVAQHIPVLNQYFATVIIRNFSVWDWIGAFTGKAGQFQEEGYPLVFQFWFIRDLLVLNVFFVVIKKLVDRFPAAAFVVLLLLWVGGVTIYLVSAGALFFFTLGYYLVKYPITLDALDGAKWHDIACVYGITITARLVFVDTLPVIGNINIVVGILFFIKASGCFVQNRNLYAILRLLEGQAFFVYAAHGVVLAALIKVSVKLMPMRGGWLLMHYFGICALCIALLVGIGMAFKSFSPKVFALLTGGR